MKQTFFVASMLLATLFSCNNNVDINDETTCNIKTRAIVTGNNTSISNPNLLNDWENVDTIVINTLGTDTNNKRVTTPWHKEGSSSSLSENFRKDIKKVDGWKMLFHTFKSVGLDEKQNYMCFYNIFTGYIKVFYYYEGNNQNQNIQWYVMTSDGQNVKL